MRDTMARYEAVKHYVTTRIEDGTFGPGDMLPSENALVKKLDVSRMTVNRAFRELVVEGIITRRAGLGSFVAEGRMRGQAADIISIRTYLQERGHLWSARVMDIGIAAMNETAGTIFEGPEYETVQKVNILHLADGEPFELEHRTINPVVAPDFLKQDFTKVTTTEYLLSVAPMLTAEHIVRAVLPDPASAALLGIPATAPCLEICRTTWTGRRPASFTKFLYPGDRYEVTTRFQQSGVSVP